MTYTLTDTYRNEAVGSTEFTFTDGTRLLSVNKSDENGWPVFGAFSELSRSNLDGSRPGGFRGAKAKAITAILRDLVDAS